jgi:hypothetical protein
LFLHVISIFGGSVDTKSTNIWRLFPPLSMNLIMLRIWKY